MAAPDPYAGIATADQSQPAAQDPYAGVATAAPAAAPGAVIFSDTGQAAPDPQAKTWNAMVSAGQIDPQAPYGSPKHPAMYRPGDNLDPGATYIDVNGAVRTSPAEIPASGITKDVDPRTGGIVDPRMNPVTAGWAAAPNGPVNPVGDVVQTIPGSLIHGAEQAASAPRDVGDLVSKGLNSAYYWTREHLPPWLGGMTPAQALNEQYGAQAQKPGPDPFLPISGAELSALEKDITDKFGGGQELYQPKTVAGRVANSIGELVPSTALGGEGLVGRIAPAVAGGALGQGAAEVTRGTELEPWARAGATVLGAGGVGALTQPATVGKMLSQGAKGLTQDQIDLATGLMQRGEQMGVPISSAEAVNQVTGGSFPGLTRLQRVAEGTREGQAIYGPAMAQRPQQLADALRSTVLDPLGKPVDMPSALGPRAQQAATGAIRSVEKARTAAVDPFYTAAAGDQVPAADMEALLQRIDADVGTDKTGIIGQHAANLRDLLTDRPAVPYDPGDPLNGIPPTPGSARVPITDIGNLDRIRKFQRDTIAARTVGQDAIPAEQAGQIGSYLDHLDGLMEANSDAFRQGKALYGKLSDQVVMPVTASPLGDVSRTGDLGAQTSAIFPSAPPENSAQETALALRMLDGQSPGLASDLTRQHLAGTWNQASRGAVPNQWVGANWYKQALGNPEQKAATLAGAGQAGGPDLAAALSNFGDVAQATGWRARQGSATAFNQEDLADMGHGGPAGTVLKALNIPEIPQMLHDAFQRWQVGRNSEALANSFIAGSPKDRTAILTEALKNHPTTLPGWASKLLLYDNPVIPGREPKKEGASAP